MGRVRPDVAQNTQVDRRDDWRRAAIFPRVSVLVPLHQLADPVGSGATPSLEQVPSGETSAPEPGTQVPWGESGGPSHGSWWTSLVGRSLGPNPSAHLVGV